MSTTPLVSVIIPTRNSAATLEACLQSVQAQTYPHTEIIVVDRDSTDTTKSIAKRHTSHVYKHGPERSAQRNFGVEKACGEYVCIVDSDMELTPDVIKDCVAAMRQSSGVVGVIIPEVSFGIGFWAQCKALERSFYNGFEPIEAARFISRQTYSAIGGFDSTLVAGEDWDLSNRLKQKGNLARISSAIRHNEGHIKLTDSLRKKYYYAQHAREYLAKNPQSKMLSAAGPLARYKLFLSQPFKLLHNPVVGIGMLLMKTAEFSMMIGAYTSNQGVRKCLPSNRSSQ